MERISSAAAAGRAPRFRWRLQCQRADRQCARHDLMLTTARQGEQGRGRRHVPGLRPPDHVGSQPPVRSPARGIHPGPGIVPNPQIPQRHGHPGDLVVARGAVVAGGRRRSCGLLRPALGGDHVPRGAMEEDVLLLHRSRPMVIRTAKTVLSACLGGLAARPWRNASSAARNGERQHALSGVATKVLHYPTGIRWRPSVLTFCLTSG